jgi:hypothetical protein
MQEAETPNTAGEPKSKREPAPVNKYETIYGRLPFVDWRPKGRRTGSVFWAPSSTGDYETDCLLGRAYAREAIPVMLSPDGRQLLRNIVGDILRYGNYERDHGLIVGMFGAIGERLAWNADRRPLLVAGGRGEAS